MGKGGAPRIEGAPTGASLQRAPAFTPLIVASTYEASTTPGPVRTGLLTDICHSFSHRPRSNNAGCRNQSAGRQDARGYREVQSAGVRSPLVSAGDRETSLGHGVIPLTRRYDLGLRACWQAGDESGERGGRYVSDGVEKAILVKATEANARHGCHDARHRSDALPRDDRPLPLAWAERQMAL